jgi:hypothetical protein
LLLKRLIDADLLHDSEQGAEYPSDRETEDWDEEQEPEQHSPEHPPGHSLGDGVVIRRDRVLAVLVADDHRHGLWFDDQIAGETVDLLRRLLGRLLVVVKVVPRGVELEVAVLPPSSAPLGSV